MVADRHNCTGKQAYYSGQTAKAINSFQRALQANPNNPDAYYNLAATYATMGQQSQNGQWLEQSEQLYRQAISLNEGHVDAHRGLAALLVDNGRQQHAFDLLNTWQQRNPTSTEPLIELARLYHEYGDNRRATDLLSDALRINANDTRALKAMGRVREMQGQVDLAMQNYLRVLQLLPGEQEVANRVAQLQPQLNQVSGMVQSPQRYGAANPTGQNR